MGFDTGAGGRSRGTKHDINITPLVDVVLVLLIFFMIAVPMLMRQVVVDVPPESPPDVAPPDNPVVASIRPDLSIELDDGIRRQTVMATELATTLRPILDGQRNMRKLVFVDFDPVVPWDDVISIIGTIRSLSTSRGVDGRIDFDEIAVAVKTSPRTQELER
jgi:biopolymer transport protein ExbD